MPTYDYTCSACKQTFEIFHSMKDAPKKKCPSCGKNALERQLGTGGAIIFKGSGFYQTDYRTESYKKAADADKPASATPSDASTAKAATPAAPAANSSSPPASKSSSGGDQGTGSSKPAESKSAAAKPAQDAKPSSTAPSKPRKAQSKR